MIILIDLDLLTGVKAAGQDRNNNGLMDRIAISAKIKRLEAAAASFVSAVLRASV
jgi:hypothetical protein